MMGRVFKVVGIAVVAVLVVASLGEAAVRWFAPQEHMPPDLFVTDPILGYRVAPNYRGAYVTRTFSVPLETNSLGLRDHEYGPRASDSIRLLLLGDSFVFGNRVRNEETVSKTLEHSLRARFAPTRVDVINGGLPGYSTYQESMFLERYIDQLTPDLVLLVTCVPNDVADNVGFTARNISEGGAGAWRAGTGGLRAKVTLLLKRSELYLVVRRAYNEVLHGEETAEAPLLRLSPEEITQGLTMTIDAVTRMAGMARDRGVGFGVLVVGVQPTVYPLPLQQEINARFAALASERGVPIVDLLPPFTARAGDGLYFTVHWTPRGHSVVAAAAEEFILGRGLLPKGTRPPS